MAGLFVVDGFDFMIGWIERQIKIFRMKWMAGLFVVDGFDFMIGWIELKTDQDFQDGRMLCGGRG
jgi:hypothetical protein